MYATAVALLLLPLPLQRHMIVDRPRFGCQLDSNKSFTGPGPIAHFARPVHGRRLLSALPLSRQFRPRPDACSVTSDQRTKYRTDHVCHP
jgi:hypothetical protein